MSLIQKSQKWFVGMEDRRYLRKCKKSGLRVNKVPVGSTGQHNICVTLRSNHHVQVVRPSIREAYYACKELRKKEACL